MSKLSSVICNLIFINTYELNTHRKNKKVCARVSD